jgi:hypothetical protein
MSHPIFKVEELVPLIFHKICIEFLSSYELPIKFKSSEFAFFYINYLLNYENLFLSFPSIQFCDSAIGM